jgi:hypothetical protein
VIPASARAQPPHALSDMPLNSCCRVLQRRRGFRSPCHHLTPCRTLAPYHPQTPIAPPQRRLAAPQPPLRRRCLSAPPSSSTPHTPPPSASTFLSTPPSPLPTCPTLTATLPSRPPPPPLLRRSGAHGLSPLLCAAAVLGKLRVRFRAPAHSERRVCYNREGDGASSYSLQYSRVRVLVSVRARYVCYSRWGCIASL